MIHLGKAWFYLRYCHWHGAEKTRTQSWSARTCTASASEVSPCQSTWGSLAGCPDLSASSFCNKSALLNSIVLVATVFADHGKSFCVDWGLQARLCFCLDLRSSTGRLRDLCHSVKYGRAPGQPLSTSTASHSQCSRSRLAAIAKFGDDTAEAGPGLFAGAVPQLGSHGSSGLAANTAAGGPEPGAESLRPCAWLQDDVEKAEA